MQRSGGSCARLPQHSDHARELPHSVEALSVHWQHCGAVARFMQYLTLAAVAVPVVACFCYLIDTGGDKKEQFCSVSPLSRTLVAHCVASFIASQSAPLVARLLFFDLVTMWENRSHRDGRSLVKLPTKAL